MWFTRKPPSFIFKRQPRDKQNPPLAAAATEAAAPASPNPDKTSADHSESDESFLSEREIAALRAQRPRRWLAFAVGHVVLFTVYVATILVLLAEIRSLRKYGPRLVNSPANGVVEWEEAKFVQNNPEHGPYTGTPSAEIDQNWHDLLNAENIIIEREIMAQLGRDAFGVAVPDGEGFLGTLNVYHELHCIKRLYQFTYPEIYGKDDTPKQREANRVHKDHCLDFLRQASMCHADVGLITFQWAGNTLVPVANATTHQCANWKKLDEWTKARTVNMMKPGWLIHPSKGPAYPEGEEGHMH